MLTVLVTSRSSDAPFITVTMPYVPLLPPIAYVFWACRMPASMIVGPVYVVAGLEDQRVGAGLDQPRPASPPVITLGMTKVPGVLSRTP